MNIKTKEFIISIINKHQEIINLTSKSINYYNNLLENYSNKSDPLYLDCIKHVSSLKKEIELDGVNIKVLNTILELEDENTLNI